MYQPFLMKSDLLYLFLLVVTEEFQSRASLTAHSFIAVV